MKSDLEEENDKDLDTDDNKSATSGRTTRS